MRREFLADCHPDNPSINTDLIRNHKRKEYAEHIILFEVI